MARAAAIIGTTPPFLRWAIERACPLRRNSEKLSVPEATFRQLRSLNELSLGQTEGRVFQGVCFDRDTTNGAMPIRAFMVDEVLAANGGANLINSSCSGCPANAAEKGNGWAGCFGWLAMLPKEELGSPDKASVAWADRLHQLNELIDGCEMERELVGLGRWASSRWHGLWRIPILKGDELSILKAILKKLVEQFETQEWDNLLAAIEACEASMQSLHVELFPIGDSDGVTWIVPRHCGECKFEQANKSGNHCACCGAQGKMEPQRHRKVLGLRPYMELEKILGREKSESLLRELLMSRGPIESGT